MFILFICINPFCIFVSLPDNANVTTTCVIRKQNYTKMQVICKIIYSILIIKRLKYLYLNYI